MAIKETIGTRIKELREKKRLTQPELAEIINIKRPSITAYESGNQLPPVDTLIKIAFIQRLRFFIPVLHTPRAGSYLHNFFNFSTDFLISFKGFDLVGSFRIIRSPGSAFFIPIKNYHSFEW